MTAATFLVCNWLAWSRLLGEHRAIEPVTGAVEADDEAVADQLVLSNSLDVGDVLDAHLGRDGPGGDKAGKADEQQ